MAVQMFEELSRLYEKPRVFSVYTAETLWTEPHLAQQMLKMHLDQSTPLASRPLTDIEQTVAWLDHRFELNGKDVCDLGCGPGLFAERYAHRGANVHGLDFSINSIDFAKSRSTLGKGKLTFEVANYLTDPIPEEQDLVTLIYCDLCALSPVQRQALLRKARQSLKPGGAMVFDVFSMKAFDTRSETVAFGRNFMEGFWSAEECFVFHKTWRYDADQVSLDHFIVYEDGKSWQVYNWLQYYSPDTLKTELNRSGFDEVEFVEGFDASDEGRSFAVVARSRSN